MRFEIIAQGTVTEPMGFTAGAGSCGIKASGQLDLALIYSESNCTAAGVFTKNQVIAAPVILISLLQVNLWIRPLLELSSTRTILMFIILFGYLVLLLDPKIRKSPDILLWAVTFNNW